MRYLIILLSAIFLGFSVSASYADQAVKKDAVDTIELHAAPSDTSKVIKTIDPWQKLVPIYKQKDWLKVGDPENGQVGWVNIQKYQKMLSDLAKAAIQYVMVNVAGNPDEKDQNSIVGYKNGKKLTSEQSEKLMQQMEERQEQIRQKFQAIQDQMNDMFDQSMEELKDINSSGVLPKLYRTDWMEPIVILTQPTENKGKDADAKTSKPNKKEDVSAVSKTTKK
jgi:chaperonin cofactor prefoldin